MFSLADSYFPILCQEIKMWITGIKYRKFTVRYTLFVVDGFHPSFRIEILQKLYRNKASGIYFINFAHFIF